MRDGRRTAAAALAEVPAEAGEGGLQVAEVVARNGVAAPEGSRIADSEVTGGQAGQLAQGRVGLGPEAAQLPQEDARCGRAHSLELGEAGRQVLRARRQLVQAIEVAAVLLQELSGRAPWTLRLVMPS